MPKKREQLATLTPLEDKCWTFAFLYYLDLGFSDLGADRKAWRDVQMDFPRLRNYDGCKP
jgi:hypothetical protein